MTDLVKQITNDLPKKKMNPLAKIGIADVWTVLEAGDGIARATAWQTSDRRNRSVCQCVMGIAFNLEKDGRHYHHGRHSEIAEGMGVRATGRMLGAGGMD